MSVKTVKRLSVFLYLALALAGVLALQATPSTEPAQDTFEIFGQYIGGEYEVPSERWRVGAPFEVNEHEVVREGWTVGSPFEVTGEGRTLDTLFEVK